MALEDMRAATLALLRYVREEKKPEGPNPLPRALVPWEADLRGQERGGSANHGWLAWLVEYCRDAMDTTPEHRGANARARTYFLDRLRRELRHGLMAHEQMSPTYGGLHLGCVCILWWVSWARGDEEIQRLAGAWIERVLLVECLCGRREGDRIRLMSPGMRADVRSVTHGRQVESAIVGTLLGLPQDLRLDHSTWWGPLWDAVRACEGVGMAAARVRDSCFDLLIKGEPSQQNLMGQIRLLVPMRFHAWPSGDWFAWIPKGGGQDPPCMGSGWIEGEHVVLWPWEDGSDPEEGGWRAEAKAVIVSRANEDAWSRRVEASWYRNNHLAKEDWINLPPAPTPELIGGPSGPDPTKDLPPELPMREHPWRQSGRGEPEEEEPKMVPRWRMKRWLRSAPPGGIADALVMVAWQAQRLRDGEPQARERLEGAVDELRKEVRDG